MVEIVFFSLIIVGIVWFALNSTEESNKMRDVNTKLFVRTWAHEKFLMKIYNDCPPNVQKEIEHYMNNIKEL